ncbi:MAG: aminoacetone oxidase family FAD-binding enzyme, partial [Pyrinomonadaceae bacterium]|nr:aminoacetone oxidase family FAD-binding enzyme [Pyrinomonadaceae bacterium]
CNFTNLEVSPENFVSENPHFAKSPLARYSPDDFISLVQKHGIKFYEKTLGQLFCRGSSREIVEMLLDECESAGVEVVTDCGVRGVSAKNGFVVNTTKGDFSAEKLVIASGGLSFPKIGATGFGYEIARQFGLKIIETRPSLVPLRFSDRNHAALSGVSLEATVKTSSAAFTENILFTHRGLSGPAILQISNYWDPQTPVSFDLMPRSDLSIQLDDREGNKMKVRNFLSRYLPKRFLEEFLPREIAVYPVASLSDKDVKRLTALIHNWEVSFSETEGWHKAEVTIGGVDTSEISSKTMESRKVPGLYFIGEVLDVTGWLGGYNFQWAWSSGYACGNAL